MKYSDGTIRMITFARMAAGHEPSEHVEVRHLDAGFYLHEAQSGWMVGKIDDYIKPLSEDSKNIIKNAAYMARRFGKNEITPLMIWKSLDEVTNE